MKSMTGFGKSTCQNEHYQIDVEIKSVNQRFLDIQPKIPKELNPYELEIRQLVKEQLNRGRVEVFVSLSYTTNQQKEVTIHWDMIQPMLDEIESHLAKRYNEVVFDPVTSLNQLLNNESYVEIKEQPANNQLLQQDVLNTVNEAVLAVEKSRQQEGQKILLVLQNYCLELRVCLKELMTFSKAYEQDFRERFETKLQTWLGDQVNEERLLTEMVILLEKGDIQEEVERLSIHIDKAEELFLQKTPVGRELDFIIQEMNREVNTIGSKSSPMTIKNLVVQMKTTIEKIREQIQNIE